MPNHKSNKKRMKTSALANTRNRAIRSQLKKFIKDLESCKTKVEAEGKLRHAVSIIDKAVRDKVIHRNKAARDKSRLTQFVRGLAG